MPILWRSLIVGGAMVMAIAWILDAGYELKPLFVALGVASAIGALALRSWWSLIVVPAAFVVGFAGLAGWLLLTGDGERVTDGFASQLLFIVLAAELGVLIAALSTVVVKLL